MNRPLRVFLTLVVTGLCTAYVLWKIDLGKTARVIVDANALYFLGALALMVVTIIPMAWRWQLLLRAKGVEEEIPWLTRAYFVSYAVGQVLPTSVGGDASRIWTEAADSADLKRRIGALPVVEGGQIVGIMSERDVIYCLRDHGAEVLGWPVSRVMTSPAITADPTTPVLSALGLMTQRRIRHLPVVEGGRIIGIVSIGDLVKHRMDHIEAEADAMRSYIQSA